MNEDPRYKYRIIKNEYLDGNITYSAQRTRVYFKDTFFCFIIDDWENLTLYMSFSYEGTLEQAIKAKEHQIKSDYSWYIKNKIKSKSVVK